MLVKACSEPWDSDVQVPWEDMGVVSGSEVVRDPVDSVAASFPHPPLDLQHTHPPIAGSVGQ